jgi:glycosyltransferase involved in cell wall biosynthesis
MKILLVAPYFFEPHRWNIAAYKTAFSLARIGIDVVVVTSGSKGQPRVDCPAPRLKVYRFRDIFIPDPANYGILPFLSLRLTSVLRKEMPSHFLVFTHMFYTSLSVVWLKLLGKRVVLVTDTFPGIDWFGRSRLVNVVLWLYARTLGLLNLKLADRVALLHEGLVPTANRLGLRSVVLPYGVEMHRYRSPPEPSDLHKAQGAVWLAYVGRLESVKNCELVLEMAREITARYSHTRFLVVGDVRGKDDLVQRYQSDSVLFLGHRDDVPSLLALADIFVLASLSEGLPSALMEAMASGCACVATSVGGIPHLFSRAEGGAGLLVPPNDAAALTDAVTRLIEDGNLRAQLGRRAKSVIEENFQMDQLAEKLVSLLETT